MARWRKRLKKVEAMAYDAGPAMVIRMLRDKEKVSAVELAKQRRANLRERIKKRPKTGKRRIIVRRTPQT